MRLPYVPGVANFMLVEVGKGREVFVYVDETRPRNQGLLTAWELREHGVATYKEAALAVLEVDGSISVLKYDDIGPTAQTHLNRRRFPKRN